MTGLVWETFGRTKVCRIRRENDQLNRAGWLSSNVAGTVLPQTCGCHPQAHKKSAASKRLALNNLVNTHESLQPSTSTEAVLFTTITRTRMFLGAERWLDVINEH